MVSWRQLKEHKHYGLSPLQGMGGLKELVKSTARGKKKKNEARDPIQKLLLLLLSHFSRVQFCVTP